MIDEMKELVKYIKKILNKLNVEYFFFFYTLFVDDMMSLLRKNFSFN